MHMDYGLRTTRDFEEGEIVAEYSGDLILNYAEYLQREKQYDEARVKGGYQFQFNHKGKTLWLVYIQI